MNNKIKTLIVSLLCFASLSCSSQITFEDVEDVKSIDSKAIAKNYVENLFQKDSYFRTSENPFPEHFYTLEIVNKDGDKILFEDLPEEEKVAFVQMWTETTIDNITEKIDQDETLKVALSIDNTAFNKAVKSAERAIIKSKGAMFNDYLAYTNKLSKYYERSASSASTKDSSYVDNVTLNNYTYGLYKSYYEPGRVLVCSDSSSQSSSSSFVGHASIMRSSSWQSHWNYNPAAKTTITSYPGDKNANWTGKVDGVQYEPLGIWVGTGPSCAAHASIYKVGSSVWVWDWFNSHYAFTSAPSYDYYRAACNAENIESRHPAYNWNFLNKNDTSKYYCSQLVWRAWYDVNNKYDLSWAAWIAPADIASSNSSFKIVDLYNR